MTLPARPACVVGTCLRGGYCGRHVGTRSLTVARAGRPQFGIEHLKRRTVGLDLHSVGGARALGSRILVISRAGRGRLRAPVCRIGHASAIGTSGTFPPSPALRVAAPSRPRRIGGTRGTGTMTGAGLRDDPRRRPQRRQPQRSHPQRRRPEPQGRLSHRVVGPSVIGAHPPGAVAASPYRRGPRLSDIKIALLQRPGRLADGSQRAVDRGESCRRPHGQWLTSVHRARRGTWRAVSSEPRSPTQSRGTCRLSWFRSRFQPVRPPAWLTCRDGRRGHAGQLVRAAAGARRGGRRRRADRERACGAGAAAAGER